MRVRNNSNEVTGMVVVLCRGLYVEGFMYDEGTN